MISRLLLTALVLLGIILLIRHFARIKAALKRFDDENARKAEDEARDRSDGLAHFRHTLKAAEERVEKIHEIIEHDAQTGADNIQYLFHGKVYATKREAEAARAEAVRAIAKQFYTDLPRALSERPGDDKLN